MPKQEIAIDLLREALDRGEEVALSTRTDSMSPFLQPGQIFRVKKVPCQEIKPGDIVCFESGGCVVVHRVVKIFCQQNERFLISKGDRLFQLDRPVPSTKVLGRVIQIGNLRLDSAAQEIIAQVAARLFYWHYRGYYMFWQMPVMEFLGRLKQRFISNRSFFMPLYMLILWPVYRFFSNTKTSRRV